MKRLLMAVMVLGLMFASVTPAEARKCRHRPGIPAKLTKEQDRVLRRIHRIFPGRPLADHFVRVAWGESRLTEYPKDNRNRNGSIDVGTMQINMAAHGRHIRANGWNVRDPEQNVLYAYDLYKRAGKQPWC